MKEFGVQRATRVVSLETRVVSLADLLVRLVILLGVVWSFLENIYILIFGCFKENLRFALALCFENSLLWRRKEIKNLCGNCSTCFDSYLIALFDMSSLKFMMVVSFTMSG